MDNEKTINQEMEEALRAKVEEFSNMDLADSNAKDAAEAVNKATDALCKLEQQKQSKKDWILKALTIAGGVASAAVAAIITAISQQKIADKQIEYCHNEHERAYDFELNGETKFLVTSPSARDGLKERPKFKS